MDVLQSEVDRQSDGEKYHHEPEDCSPNILGGINDKISPTVQGSRFAIGLKSQKTLIAIFEMFAAAFWNAKCSMSSTFHPRIVRHVLFAHSCGPLR